MYMKKRGQAEVLQTMLLFELLLGILIAGILIYSASNFGTMTNFNEEFLEKDLSLMSNTILAAPGKIIVVYPIDSNYNIEITETVNVETSKSLVHTDSELRFFKPNLDNNVQVERIDE